MFRNSKKDSKHESKLGPVAGIIGGIVAILIVIISVHNLFPAILFYFLITILILAIVILIFYVSSPPVIRYIQKQLTRRKQNKVFWETHGEFKYYVEKFEEFANVNRRHNVATALYDLGVIEDPFEKNVKKFGDNLIDKSIFSSLFDLYQSFSTKINYRKMGVEDFKSIINEFDAILEMYNRLICKSVEKIKKLSKEGSFSDSKEGYRECRDRYVSYLKGYIDFSEKNNKKLEEKIFRVYFDFPKEL